MLGNLVNHNTIMHLSSFVVHNKRESFLIIHHKFGSSNQNIMTFPRKDGKFLSSQLLLQGITYWCSSDDPKADIKWTID